MCTSCNFGWCLANDENSALPYRCLWLNKSIHLHLSNTCCTTFQVCSNAEQEVLDRGSKKSERLHDFLMKQTPSTNEISSSVNDNVDDGLRKALEHRDRLLEYDKTR